MKAKRKSSLPRVTVMAYNRRDLVAFVQAVETLRLLVQDLRTVADELKAVTKRKPRAAVAAAAAEPPASPAGGSV